MPASPDLASLSRRDRIVLAHALSKEEGNIYWPEDKPELAKAGARFESSFEYAARVQVLRDAAQVKCPRCKSSSEDDDCRTCGVHYCDGGDGWDGECPDCADKSESKRLLRNLERRLERAWQSYLTGRMTDTRVISKVEDLLEDFDGDLSVKAAYQLGRLAEATGGSFQVE